MSLHLSEAQAFESGCSEPLTRPGGLQVGARLTDTASAPGHGPGRRTQRTFA